MICLPHPPIKMALCGEARSCAEFSGVPYPRSPLSQRAGWTQFGSTSAILRCGFEVKKVKLLPSKAYCVVLKGSGGPWSGKWKLFRKGLFTLGEERQQWAALGGMEFVRGRCCVWPSEQRHWIRRSHGLKTRGQARDVGGARRIGNRADWVGSRREGIVSTPSGELAGSNPNQVSRKIDGPAAVSTTKSGSRHGKEERVGGRNQGRRGDRFVQEGEDGEEERDGGDGGDGSRESHDPDQAIGVFGNGDRKPARELIADLCSRVQAGDGASVTVEDIAALYPFPLDAYQEQAVRAHLGGASVVVCAPTSAGKTLVAEAAAAAALARRRRLFYTTPLKALSNQKLRDFRALFGEENVGLLTGDAAVNRDAPIMIMTAEVLRNMLYLSPREGTGHARLASVAAVVLDEVHYLNDASRGTVWEEIVIYCPRGVQLIGLSATVANPEELAGWIRRLHGRTELVTSYGRPVPLTWQYSTRSGLVPLFNDRETAVNRRLARVVPEAPPARRKSPPRRGKSGKGWKVRLYDGWDDELDDEDEDEEEDEDGRGGTFGRQMGFPHMHDTVRQLVAEDMLPAIWFIFSRRGCDEAARSVAEVDFLSRAEARKVRRAVDEFAREHPHAVRESALEALARGAAAHHAGCLPAWKAFVEGLFQRGLVKLVFATETLAAGINMPARTAVLASISKKAGVGGPVIPLSSTAMLQMAGRAGRRGIDQRGYAVVVQTQAEGADLCCRILLSGVDPLVSRFTATYGMVLNLLAAGNVPSRGSNSVQAHGVAGVPFGRSLQESRELVERSFGNYVGGEVLFEAREQLVLLRDEVRRLVQKTQMESLTNVLESKLTLADREIYRELKDIVEATVGAPLGSRAHYVQDLIHPHVLEGGVPLGGNAAALCERFRKTEGYKEYRTLVLLHQDRLEKIENATAKIRRISKWIDRVSPMGWKEFLNVVDVLQAVGAINLKSGELRHLGQIAAALRADNELWVALVLSEESLRSLTSAQLAAVCGSLVSEGLKFRAEYGQVGTLHVASLQVQNFRAAMQLSQEWLCMKQSKRGVYIPCHFDVQFAGIVEAWMAGLTWKELMDDCALDDGDVARLLRRTADLLAQIPHLPYVSPHMVNLANEAARVIDRPPINDLFG